MRLLNKPFPLQLCFFIPLLIFIYSNAHTQQADFNFTNFNNKDGLSSNSVNTIIKDRYGYMWFGTSDGLNRFDGVNFTVYRYKIGDSTSLGGNDIMSLAEDEAGNIWVGTNQSLSFYDRNKDAFVNYDFVRNVSARALAIDHLGNLWVGSYAGLYRFNPKTGDLKHYTAKANKPGHLKSNTVVAIFEDSQHRLWIGTNLSLHRYVPGQDNFIAYEYSASDPTSIAGQQVRSISESPDGSLWFATYGGISQLVPGAKGFRNYRHSADPASLSCDRVYVIVPDYKGKLWIGTDRGLNIMDPATGKVIRINNDPRNSYSLVGKSVRTIYIDKNGIFWMGAHQAGINKYDTNLAFFNLRQSNPLDPSGLKSPIVTSFVESLNGNVYVGTDGGGLNFFDRKTGLFSHPVLNGKNGKVSTIMAMERVGDELWIGTYQEDLHVLNMISGATRRYTAGNGPQNVSSNEIFCIKKDRQGKVWLGTNGYGVNVFNPQTGAFQKFNQETLAPDAKFLSNGYIRSIEEDNFGNIWIGSQGAGLAIYNPSSGKFQILNRSNSNLPSNNIYSIHAGKDGNIWIGSSGGGLSLVQKNNSSFISFSEADGLANPVVYKILEDDFGKIWVSTNKGISSFEKTSRRFKNYSFNNGLQRSAFSLGAGMKTSKGEMFFGGLDGFNYFDPKYLRSNKNIPELAFADLKISNRSVSPGEKSAIREHISMAKEIHLDFKQNFSLDFVALNYTAPQESRYFYKLEGFDKEWNDVGASHSAVYTNLDPGEYTFRVKAKSDDDLWSTPEKTIRIYVKPPFWRTTYAYIFYVASIILAIAYMRHRGIRKLKNKFALEQERLKYKQMIEEEKRERQRQHEFNESKIKFLTNLSHEFRTPISLILGPIERMLGNEASKEKTEQLTLVKRNARRLLSLVNQLLDFRKLEEKELSLNLTEGDLIACMHDVADSFRDFSERKQVNFTFSSALERYYTYFDQDKIERIFFNLLSNAFKFTKANGKVTLHVAQQEEGMLRIEVSDTGIGMSEEEKDKVFDRFFQGSVQADILNQGSGIGLSITKEFVKLHGGSIELETEQGKGSKFAVLLPCKPLLNAAPRAQSALLGNITDKQAGEPKKVEEVPGHEKQTVLLIEDNDDFRGYLKDNLQSSYKIVEAGNGKEGWQKALSAHPKIIVSDISMPVMDGITLCKKLKSDKRTRHIPVILLTALTGDANQLKGLQTGASDYLTKPFNFDILQIKIKNLLALNQNLEHTYSKQLKIKAPEVEVQSHDEQLLLKITQYIEANIDSANLSVEELSKHVFMSRGSLYNKIVNLTGETPVEFIRSIKLNKALALLENSDLKIAEIAYSVGFATPNYFARAFKAKYNVSPTEYLSLKKNNSGSNDKIQSDFGKILEDI